VSIAAQLLGAGSATALFRWLVPTLRLEEAMWHHLIEAQPV